MRGEGDSKDFLGLIGMDLFPVNYTKVKIVQFVCWMAPGSILV